MNSNMGRASRNALSLEYGQAASATVNNASVLLSNQTDAVGNEKVAEQGLNPAMSLRIPGCEYFE